MTTNERDTHFFGFAKLLVAKLEKDGFVTPVYGVRPYTLIAQWAYDLVYHTLSNTTQAMAAECEHRPAIAEEIRHIPDLTEWPE